jgi:hypothetical protein
MTAPAAVGGGTNDPPAKTFTGYLRGGWVCLLNFPVPDQLVTHPQSKFCCVSRFNVNHMRDQRFTASELSQRVDVRDQIPI